jgi:peptidyl-tRNA hydrolase
MENRRYQQMLRKVLAEQQASNELVKLIRKLRWMGLEDEAAIAAHKLTLRRPTIGSDSVIATPGETD